MSAARASVSRALPRLLEQELERHCGELAGCHRCDAHLDAGVRPILSEARAPRVMLVGQAPGKTETTDHRPFAGRAGKTLFRWLAEAGIEEPEARRHIYIAAITRCYPGPHPAWRGDRVPSPAERERCARWLETELRIIRPELIIPVGRLAIDRFLPAGPLDRLVGRAHVVQHEGGESLAVPLPHPSGASSWIHEAGHAELLERALAILKAEFGRLGVGALSALGSRLSAGAVAESGKPRAASRSSRSVA